MIKAGDTFSERGQSLQPFNKERKPVILLVKVVKKGTFRT